MPGTGTNRLCCHYYACSHKGIIQELENRLEDERTQHSKDKAKAEAKSKADLDRVRIESAEELKHVLESAALQHKQQQDIILTLQESDKENRLAAENLRKKLVSCKAVSGEYSAVLLAAVLGPAVLKLLCADAEFLLHTW
jgi:cell division septation protein DedD